MPFEWVGTNGEAEISGASLHSVGGTPLARLHLWPHRSLPKRGFVAFIGITFALVLVPLSAVIGTPILWGLLPFVLGTLALTWALLAKSYRDGEISRIWALVRPGQPDPHAPTRRAPGTGRRTPTGPRCGSIPKAGRYRNI